MHRAAQRREAENAGDNDPDHHSDTGADRRVSKLAPLAGMGFRPFRFAWDCPGDSAHPAAFGPHLTELFEL